MALKRQQAAEDAIALGLRVCTGDPVGMPIVTTGPLWGPGTVTPPENKDEDPDDEYIDPTSSDDECERGKCMTDNKKLTLNDQIG